jgi:hypothetical protein
MDSALEKNETAIFSRALAPEVGNLSPEAARAILAIELSPADISELQRLAEPAQERALSPEEETELENYRQVGRLLELMKSKARISLKQPAESLNERQTSELVADTTQAKRWHPF